MTTIYYQNYRMLRSSYCDECEEWKAVGCAGCDPLTCGEVMAQIELLTDNGYRVQVGKFRLEPSRKD